MAYIIRPWAHQSETSNVVWCGAHGVALRLLVNEAHVLAVKAAQLLRCQNTEPPGVCLASQQRDIDKV